MKIFIIVFLMVSTISVCRGSIYEPTYKVCSIFINALPHEFGTGDYRLVKGKLIVDELLQTYVESLKYTLEDVSFNQLSEPEYIRRKFSAGRLRAKEITESIDCFLSEYQDADNLYYYDIQVEEYREEGYLLIRDEEIVVRLVEYLGQIGVSIDQNGYNHIWGKPKRE